MKRSGKCAYLQQSLGIQKIKITGREPLVRKGCADLMDYKKYFGNHAGHDETTNGVLLQDNLEALKKAGLDGINISLDTLDREKISRDYRNRRL